MKTHRNLITIVLYLLLGLVLPNPSALAAEATASTDGLSITLKSTGKALEAGTVIPVQADFTHPDGKNGLAFDVIVKLQRDTTGQLTSLFLSNDSLIAAKSKPHTASKKWAYESHGSLTGRADLKKGTEFKQTLVFWLKETITPPYGQTVPIFLQISDKTGILFSKTVSLQIPTKK